VLSAVTTFSVCLRRQAEKVVTTLSMKDDPLKMVKQL